MYRAHCGVIFVIAQLSCSPFHCCACHGHGLWLLWFVAVRHGIGPTPLGDSPLLEFTMIALASGGFSPNFWSSPKLLQIALLLSHSRAAGCQDPCFFHYIVLNWFYVLLKYLPIYLLMFVEEYLSSTPMSFFYPRIKFTAWAYGGLPWQRCHFLISGARNAKLADVIELGESFPTNPKLGVGRPPFWRNLWLNFKFWSQISRPRRV